MAVRSLGSLTVDLVLKMGGFKEGMDRAARETDKANQALRGMAREGQRLADTLKTPFERLGDQAKRYTELLKGGAISQQTYFRAIAQATAEYNASNPAVQRRNALIAEGAKLTQSLRTPQEQLTASLRRYDALLKSGAISQETFNRAVRRSRVEFEAASKSSLGTMSSMSRLQSLFVGGGIALFAKGAIEARVAFESLNATLKAVTGSQEAANAELQFAGTTARDLGLNFEATVKSYAKFTAAARGTALEGQQTRDVFTAVAEASRVLGLSAADTEGVFLALGQMISRSPKNACGSGLPG